MFCVSKITHFAVLPPWGSFQTARTLARIESGVWPLCMSTVDIPKNGVFFVNQCTLPPPPNVPHLQISGRLSLGRAVYTPAHFKNVHQLWELLLQLQHPLSLAQKKTKVPSPFHIWDQPKESSRKQGKTTETGTLRFCAYKIRFCTPESDVHSSTRVWKNPQAS